MTAQPPSAAPLPADRGQDEDTSEHPEDPDATDGQLSEGPNSLSTSETSEGGADAVPDTHG